MLLKNPSLIVAFYCSLDYWNKCALVVNLPGIRVLRFYLSLGKENMMEHIGDIPSVYKWEMMNKAVHAADRGGNLNVLK
nr:hypothetical protein CFP56_49622 [Quercus suber]